MSMSKRLKFRKTNAEEKHDERVEVVVTQNSNKEVVEQAKEVNEKLKKVLQDNHFTVYIVAGIVGKKKKGLHNGVH